MFISGRIGTITKVDRTGDRHFDVVAEDGSGEFRVSWTIKTGVWPRVGDTVQVIDDTVRINGHAQSVTLHTT